MGKGGILNTDQQRRDVINVAVTIDRNYVQPLGVMLHSLLSNTNCQIQIYLLHSDLEQMHIERLDALIAQHDHAKINYHQIHSKKIDSFLVNGHLTTAMYYIFLLPNILPTSVDKVLYLDPDVVVLSDIEKLWTIKIENNFLAAVPILATPRKKILKAHDDYFNTGVVLINLNEWRTHNIMKKSLNAVVKLADYIKFPDQDVLNVIAKGRWKKLPLCWNKRPDFYLNQGNSIYSSDETETAKKEIGIIHFTGPVKPWHYACSHPKRNVYVKYKLGTPWANEPLQGKNFISFLSRITPYRIGAWITRKLAHSALARYIKKRSIGC